MTPLLNWENFYVIVGTSAGALTGLQFVATALVADLPVRRASSQTADAFATPNIVHFGAVLMLSAVLSAPWRGMAGPMGVCGLGGVIGVAYAIVVVRRFRAQTEYHPVFEDWLFHVLLPALAYGLLAAAAYTTRFYMDALFGVATAALLLLFVGIHNAWDTVTYLIFVRRQEQRENSQ